MEYHKCDKCGVIISEPTEVEINKKDGTVYVYLCPDCAEMFYYNFLNCSKENVCCLCKKKFVGFGNNPYPLSDVGICCDECNKLVVDERLKKYLTRTKEAKE